MKIDPWDPELAKAWIRQALYRDLLRKWRFEPVGSPWFADDVGEVFEVYFKKARAKISTEEAVRISKEVGWDSSTANRGRYDDRRK